MVFLVAGETLVDFFPVACGERAGYIPHPGGSPHNVAIGLGRLGVPVGYLGKLSRDLFGRMLKQSLRTSGVDLRYLAEEDAPTALSFIHASGGEEPEFSFYGEGTADALLTPAFIPNSFPAEIKAIHVGSLAMMREPIGTTLTGLLLRESGNRVISFDPNVRPNQIKDRSQYLKRFAEWLSQSNVVKVSRADLDYLYPGKDEACVVQEWFKRGPQLVVVTHGAIGANAYTPTHHATVDGARVVVVDTVGAGDAFTVGLLAWLHEHDRVDPKSLAVLSKSDLHAALKQAARIAAITCTRLGADPPWESELRLS